MLMHEICGYPANDPEAEPLRLLVNPGTASPQEIAELLSSMSELSQLMGIEGGVRWEVSGRTLDTHNRDSVKNFPEVPNLGEAFKPLSDIVGSCPDKNIRDDLGVDFFDH